MSVGAPRGLLPERTVRCVRPPKGIGSRLSCEAKPVGNRNLTSGVIEPVADERHRGRHASGDSDPDEPAAGPPSGWFAARTVPGGTPRRHLPLPPRAAEAPRRHLRSIEVPLPVERRILQAHVRATQTDADPPLRGRAVVPDMRARGRSGRRATAIPFYTFSVAEIARALILVLRVRPNSPARSNASSSDTASGSSDLGIGHDRRGARPPMTRGRSNPYGMRTFVKSVPS